METPQDQKPSGVAVQYHAHIPFDILRRSIFIPDALLDQQTDRLAFIREKVDQLLAVMLSSEVAHRVSVVEIHGQTAKDGDKLIPGRYIELRLPVGVMPTVVDADGRPLGNVVMDVAADATTN